MTVHSGLSLVFAREFQQPSFFFTMAQRMLLRASGPRRVYYGFTRSFSTVLDTPVDPGTQQIRLATPRTTVFENALNAKAPRTNWTKEEISEIYNTSLIDLTYASVGQIALLSSDMPLSSIS